MLTCPTHLPIYFCAEPVDFRKKHARGITHSDGSGRLPVAH